MDLFYEPSFIENNSFWCFGKKKESFFLEIKKIEKLENFKIDFSFNSLFLVNEALMKEMKLSENEFDLLGEKIILNCEKFDFLENSMKECVEDFLEICKEISTLFISTKRLEEKIKETRITFERGKESINEEMDFYEKKLNQNIENLKKIDFLSKKLKLVNNEISFWKDGVYEMEKIDEIVTKLEEKIFGMWKEERKEKSFSPFFFFSFFSFLLYLFLLFFKIIDLSIIFSHFFLFKGRDDLLYGRDPLLRNLKDLQDPMQDLHDLLPALRKLRQLSPREAQKIKNQKEILLGLL